MTTNVPTLTPDKRNEKTNAATGVSAAGARALGSQAIAFYFRAPVKAFFRTRVDYLAVARSISPHAADPSAKWSVRTSTLFILSHALRQHGPSFLSHQLAPPLLANVAVGALLYTSYLSILGIIYPPSSHSQKRVYPPPLPHHTFLAGAAAGGLRSLGSAVPDALSSRFRVNDVLFTTPQGETKFQSRWTWSRKKLKEIGARGVFKGFGLACAKDALGYGIFFSTFEPVKAQGYYSFIQWWYSGSYSRDGEWKQERPGRVMKPHWSLEPAFLGLAGVSASFTQQLIVHPASRVQEILQRMLNSRTLAPPTSFTREFRSAYLRTAEMVSHRAARAGNLYRWLYRGFWWDTIRQVPSTAAGLIIFELVRKRYAEPAAPGEGLYLSTRDVEIELS